MAMSEAHLERRRNYIGASEIAAVLGINPWQNAYDLWLLKTGRAEPFKGNDATKRGNALEDGVIRWAAGELGVKVRRNQWRVHPNKIHAATLDAIIPDRPTEAIEVKTTRTLDGWGEEGTDQIPEHILAQTLQQMAVADLETVWVPMLGPDLALRMYRVNRDDTIIRILLEDGERFWHEHVEADVPPASVIPNVEVLKRVRREPESRTSIADEIVRAYLDAKEQEKAAKAAATEAQARLLEALGEAEAGDSNVATVTYLSQSRSGFDTKRFKQDHPELFQEYATSTSYRVLRTKEAN